MFYRRFGALAGIAIVALIVSLGVSRSLSADEEPDRAAKPPAKPPQKRRANPLQNLLQRIFRAPQGEKPDELDEASDDPRRASGRQALRDRIDARAPFEPEQGTLLHKAERRMQQGEWKRARAILQHLLDQAQDSVVRSKDGRWISIHREANRLLGQFPAEQIKNYRVQFGGLARQLLRQARRDGNFRKLAVVARRFFHTQAGYEAANAVGTRHLEQGEFGLAARYFADLLQAEASLSVRPQWQLKAALAFHRAGNADRSHQLLKRLASQRPQAGVQLGGQTVEPHDWLRKATSKRFSRDVLLDEWPVFLGNASRRGRSQGGDPILLPRWQQPLTHSRSIQREITILTQDLRGTGQTPIPALFPVLVDGKIAFRTLHGVQVLDAASGELLWQTQEGVSAARILDGSADPAHGSGRQLLRATRKYRGRQSGRHPLARLLFRNGTFGLLSSDGKQLFVLEKQAILSPHRPGSSRNRAPNRNDPFDRDWSSNQIVAYDLDSGRPRWKVGGREYNEPFDPPLAGYYFFGTPVPDGERLFVVGEKAGAIRLICLERATGRFQWRQLIGFSDANISRDLGRRWWTSQPAVGRGVVVCPTTVGWLVAVEPASGSILWAARYAPPQPEPDSRNRRRHRTNMVQMHGDLNSRWCPSAPVIASDRVVYTPSEAEKLVCLDLFEGTRLWERPKGDGLYLGGVFDDHAVLVGKRVISGVSLDNGQTDWRVQIPPDAGYPSGFGVAAENTYYVPLSTGTIWAIDLDSGQRREQYSADEGESALGNLAMYRGMLLSLGPNGLRSFEQRSALQEDIRRQKQNDPHNVQALLREAEMHLLDGRPKDALASLEEIPRAEIPQQRQEEYRRSLIKTLKAVIRSDFQKHDAAMQRLQQLVATPDEQFAYNRLAAERFLARGEFRAAFRRLQRMAEVGNQSDRWVTNPEHPHWTVRRVGWLAGRLAELWETMPEALRGQLTPEIEAEVEAIAADDVTALRRAARLYGFHPVSTAVKRRLAEAHLRGGNVAAAERVLLNLADSQKPRTAAWGLKRLEGLMRGADLPGDAAFYHRRLKQLPLPEKAEKPGNLSDDGSEKSPAAGEPTAIDPTHLWGDFDLELQRVGTNHISHVQGLNRACGKLPFFRRFRIQARADTRRLEIIDTRDESLHWSLPLRSRARSLQGNHVAAASAGHRLIVLHRDVVHCLSPIERKLLWTRPVDHRSFGSSAYRRPQRSDVQPIRQKEWLLQQKPLQQQAASRGMLAAVQNDYVAVYGRRKLIVLDPLTGDVLWRRTGLHPETLVYGARDALYVVPPDSSQSVALSPMDGRPLEVPHVAALLERTLHISGNRLILMQGQSLARLFGAAPAGRIRSYNPLTAEEDWSRQFPADTKFALLPTEHLLALQQNGDVKRLNLKTGATRQLGSVEPSAIKGAESLYATADSQRVYLVINTDRSRNMHPSRIPSLPVSGRVLAFDPADGKPLWDQKVAEQNLLLQHFDHLPVLVFAARQYVRKDELRYWSLRLQVVHKQTGRQLVQVKRPSRASLRSLSVNTVDRFIELQSYNERLRLRATSRNSEKADSTGR